MRLTTPTIEITGEEGNALREMILTHISGIDDLRMVCEAENFAQAERLGIEFGDQLRLMEDLHWTGVLPDTAIVQLTMPPKELRRVFTRLRSVVATLRAAEEREQAELMDEARRYRERTQRVADACDRVLTAIGGKGSQGREDT